MKKRLTTVGNGLALFIDKPIQKLLGLDADSIVSLETDGVRLVIEACGQREKQQHVQTTIEPWQRVQHLERSGARTNEDARVSYFAKKTFERLEELGITDSILRRLYRGLDSLFHRTTQGLEMYRSCAGRYAPSRSDTEFRSMHRLEALLEAKKKV